MKCVKEKGMKNIEDTRKKSKPLSSHIGYTRGQPKGWVESPIQTIILFFHQILKIPEIYVEANVIGIKKSNTGVINPSEYNCMTETPHQNSTDAFGTKTDR